MAFIPVLYTAIAQGIGTAAVAATATTAAVAATGAGGLAAVAVAAGEAALTAYSISSVSKAMNASGPTTVSSMSPIQAAQTIGGQASMGAQQDMLRGQLRKKTIASTIQAGDSFMGVGSSGPNAAAVGNSKKLGGG